MSDEKYVLYDRQSFYDLVDDEDWLADLAEARGVDPADLSDDAKYDQAEEERSEMLAFEVECIARRFEARVEELAPEWGDYLLMACGSAERWDGTSYGHNYYSGSWDGSAKRTVPAFEKLMGDTGRGGLFADCEIDQIWEDRTGTIHVEGVHHDGRVSVSIRAVGDWVEECESDFAAECTDGEDVVRKAWEDGVTADMAGFYGYEWPAHVADNDRSLGPAPSAGEIARDLSLATGPDSQAASRRR